MNKEQFKKYAEDYNVIPVYETITADLLTPVLAYLRIRKRGNFSFLLESVEGIGRLAIYSFIGHSPSSTILSDKNKVFVSDETSSKEIKSKLLDYLSGQVDLFNHPKIDDLPDFTGGIVGYLGFEVISEIENTIVFNNQKDDEFPEAMLGLFDSIIAFDHFKHRIILIQNVFIDKSSNLDELYEFAKNKMETLKNIIQKPVELPESFKLTGEVNDQINATAFNKKIEKIKNNIYAGDVFQLVLSERFNAEYEGDLLNLYRALRIINPSPYMYIFEFNEDLSIVGTSPEDLLKVQNNRATILPIAGTRRRGETEKDDIALEKDLLADEKEIAEHTMLVDLARNDLGRVCKHNTVELTEMMKIHRFSHVMHIVSRVEGELNENLNCIDALKASYPAGTVSGAPKIRAIQLIDDYEEISRGPYAGSVGYIDFKGNLDMCIAIRTLFADSKKIYWQAGAGIVADSKAELELKEIKNKSAVLESALKYAEVIDEVLVIDNYDSFTFNLVQLVGKFTHNIVVKRNDKITLDEIKEMNPDKIIISPGPGRPEDSNISIEIIRELGKEIPILGVCLGYQGIGICFGAKTINAPVLMHGKTSQVQHDNKTIFKDIPQNFNAGRYHSLIIEKDSINSELEITSQTSDEIVMGVRHKLYPIEGIQFHPESILTEEGENIIRNWIEL